jgi:DNA repair protein RadC
MAINNWSHEERPREKLLSKGAGSLSDAELLAILLRIGIKGKTAIDLARDLLITTGGLRQLLESDQKILCQHSGVGIAKYAQIQAALELARRHLHQNLEQKDVLKNSAETKQYLIARLRHHQQEIFACLFLDSHNQIIGYKEMFYGTIDKSIVYPREVVKKALSYNAASIIFAHNHPSGIITPSLADKQLTQRLIRSLNLIDVHVFDHIIVGDTTVFSFAENKLI